MTFLKSNSTLKYKVQAFLLGVLLAVSFAPALWANPAAVNLDQLIQETKQRVNLTDEETAWLVNHPTVDIGGPKSFPPFYYHDENSIEQGIGADYYRVIFGVLNLKVDVHRDLPWPEVLKRVKNHQLDSIVFIAKTEERTKYLNFSNPYLSFPLMIISRKDAIFIGGTEDIIKLRIACVKKNAACEWLARDYDNLDFVWVNSPLEALKTVSENKADVHFENLAAATYLMKRHQLTNLRVAAPTNYGNYDIHLAVRKDWPELVPIINKVLAAIPPSAHTAIRDKWISEMPLDQTLARKAIVWIIGIILIALAIILFILRWNRRLRLEIEHRQKLTVALKESEAVFSAVFQHSPVAITILSIASEKYLYVSDAVERFTGYSRDEMIGNKPTDMRIWKNPEERDALVRKVLKGDTVHNLEFQFTSKNGEEKTGLISGARIDSVEEPFLILVTMDITNLKQEERKRQQSELRYTALFERSLDPFIIYNTKGHLQDANPVALEMLNLSKEQLGTTDVFEFIDPEHHDLLKQVNEEIMELGRQKEPIEFRLHNKDGSSYWIEGTGTAIYEDGVIKEVQGLGRNITGRKVAEQEQKRLIAKLLDALENIKSLKGMLPICAKCKKIRDDSGYWNQIESYIEEHSDALFSHGICPECADDLYGNEAWFDKIKK